MKYQYIIKFLKILKNIIININNNIFEPLNIDTRVNVFIGIMSILVAVVIFIAETINQNKYETQKRFILKETKLKCNIILAIIILTSCFIKSILPYQENNDNNSNIIILSFFITELVLNVAIIVSIIRTILLFSISIKFNTDSDVYNEKYDEYIRERLDKINGKNAKYSNRKLPKTSMKDIIKEFPKYFSTNDKKVEGYYKVQSLKNGILKSYNKGPIQNIVDKIEDVLNEKDKYEPITKPIVIFPLEAGSKINRGVTIAYYLKEYKGLEELIRKTLILDDNIPYQDNEINLILRDIFDMADKDIYNYDNNLRLFNFYEYLYKNNMQSLINISMEYIRTIYIKYRRKYLKNKEFARFLSGLSSLAYKYEDYEHYEIIINYIYYLHRDQLYLTKDTRQVACDFVENTITYKYYVTRKNEDSIYYDEIISVLLRFIFDLLEKRKYDAINDIFENAMFDFTNYNDDELNGHDVVDLQFCFGFIEGLIVLNNKNHFIESDKEPLNRLIEKIETFFVFTYDSVKIIELFQKYYDYYSNVRSVYENFEFYFMNKKYKKSFSIIHIDKMIILKEYLYLFEFTQGNIDSIIEENVSKDDKYFFIKFLEHINSKEELSELDRLLDIKFDNKNLIKILEKLIRICKKQEDEFNRKTKLNEEQQKNFQAKMFEELEKGNELIKFLKRENKYIKSEEKGSNPFGINQLIGRELFFKKSYGIDYLVRDFAIVINSAISKKYINKLDSISKKSDKYLEKAINSINNIEDYVIITSPLNRQLFPKYSYSEKMVQVKDKKIDIIELPKVKDIYIVEKESMPVIKMKEIGEEFLYNDTYIIKNDIAYQLIDCSKNEKLRKEIISNSDWIKEKGTEEEQDEYLKGMCAFKLLVDPTIVNENHFNGIKIIIEEEKEELSKKMNL